MRVNLLEHTKNELKFELIGEGHTFSSALHAMLLKDKSVEFTGYNILHPLVAEPIIYVRTKGRRKPENALIDASENLRKYLTGLQRAFYHVVLQTQETV
ncbi:MAG: DNA-directed RNA polymerase subunit L [Candidatus Bathyarchaeota archaeon]|nr:MAG: DNA-directed RNA polymerase subunit L [Candidatus Bathyarchaeota archaeon]